MNKAKPTLKSKLKTPAKPALKTKASNAKPASKSKPKTVSKPKKAAKPALQLKASAKAAKTQSKPKNRSNAVKALSIAKTSKSKSFAVDQKVVYPSQGVGIIKEIVMKKFKDAKIPYYIIYIEVTDMTIMVPVDRAMELGIRSTVSRDEAAKALEHIEEEFETPPSDWKMRYQMNLEKLKKGSIRDIASIVRSLYQRSKIKELPILERKLFDSAKMLFIDEVSISLRKPKAEIEEMLFSRLENV